MNESTLETLEFIHNEVKEQISGFDGSRKYYRRNYYIFVLLTAGMSAITTFLIGISEIFDSKWLTVTALFTSASITVVAAWDGFFRNKEMWILKTDTLMSLYGLESNIRYLKTKGNENISEEQVKEFYDRFEEILHGEHELWKTARESQSIEVSKLTNGSSRPSGR